MSLTKKLKISEKDIIKAYKKGSREAEIKDPGYKGFKQIKKIHGHLKYNRKEKHKKNYF